MAVDPETHRMRTRLRDLEHRVETQATIIAALQLDTPGLGDPQLEIIHRIVGVWTDLALAGDPRQGRHYDGVPGSGRGSDADPARAGAYARRIKSSLNRAIGAALDTAAERLDGDWEPPPYCHRCRRGQRKTATRCDRCGHPVGNTPPETPTRPPGSTENPKRQGLLRDVDGLKNTSTDESRSYAAPRTMGRVPPEGPR